MFANDVQDITAATGSADGATAPASETAPENTGEGASLFSGEDTATDANTEATDADDGATAGTGEDIAADAAPLFPVSGATTGADATPAAPATVNDPNDRAGFRWYTIQTLSNMEGKVKKYLDKFIDVEADRNGVPMSTYFRSPAGRPIGDRVLMPEETVSETKNNRKYEKKRKLYPNYMFLQMRLYDEYGKLLIDPWFFVRNTQGVIDFIGKDAPIPLKTEEINRILQQVEEAEGKTVPRVLYNVGDEVKVIDGPFSNMIGRIENVDIPRSKLHVSVSIFGRFTPVELEFWQVERNTGD
jgi:transcriptional antiterminator NusG